MARGALGNSAIDEAVSAAVCEASVLRATSQTVKEFP